MSAHDTLAASYKARRMRQTIHDDSGSDKVGIAAKVLPFPTFHRCRGEEEKKGGRETPRNSACSLGALLSLFFFPGADDV